MEAEKGPQYWIAVASADHVERGRAEGFMQVCHGKAAPLKRIKPNDGVAYYSPTQSMGGKEKVQAFTAIGCVRDTEPYAVDMGGGFVPFRRDVAWLNSDITPIAPLLEKMQWSQGHRNWGYQMRFGVFKISAADFALIRQAMLGQASSFAEQSIELRT